MNQALNFGDPPLEDTEIETIATSIASYDPSDPSGWGGVLPDPKDLSSGLGSPKGAVYRDPDIQTCDDAGKKEADATAPASLAVPAEVPGNFTPARNGSAAPDGIENFDAAQDQRDALEMLKASDIFAGLRIKRVIRLGKEKGADYRFELERGTSVSLGTGGGLLEQRSIRKKIAAKTDFVIRKIKDIDWDEMCELIYRAAVHSELPDGMKIETLSWLAGYCEHIIRGRSAPVETDNKEMLADRLAITLDSINRGAYKEVPFMSTRGELYVHLDTFMAFVRDPLNFDLRVPRRETTLRLHGLGFMAEQIGFTSDGQAANSKRVQIRFWKSVPNFKFDH